jgi:hypothetical protein
VYVTQLVLRFDEMITTVKIPVVFQRQTPPAVLLENTKRRTVPAPRRQRLIEYLHEDPTHVLAQPFVEYRDQKISKLARPYATFSHQVGRRFYPGGRVSVSNRLLHRTDPLDQWNKLNKVNALAFKESIDLKRSLTIASVYNYQHIVVHAVFAQ